MKRVAAFFKNRFVLSFIGVLALSLLIWFGFDYVKFGADNSTLATSTRLLLILILFIIWTAHLVVVLLLERQRNGAMLDEIKGSQAAPAAPGEDPRLREEAALLGKRFSEAAQLLRKTRFKGASGSRALYQLPWYIVIGPPGAGKTTALINSGLEFPLAEAYGKGALGGVGGTRNCDWWFTNEAVLIDTAGRYTTQDSHRAADSSAWANFLQLLKKYRPRQPINGAIVAISLQDLLLQTAEQRAQHARTIRARIDELQEQLGLRFPVYILFTKCDLVAGFTEFFANLSNAEREQVWGTTYPAELTAVAAADRFGGEFDTLMQRLNQRTLWRVNNERDAAKRASIHSFPLQMGSLKGAIVEFLQQTFVANVYKEQPLLRGVYFSSGTQEGTPIDRMMAAVAANFRLGRDVGRAQAGSGKSFFITRLFRDVIFAEATLVGVNHKAERLLLWTRRGVFAALVLAIVGALGIWTGAVVRNNQFMAQVQSDVDQFHSAKQALKDEERDPAKTLPLLDPLRRASAVYDQQSHPWLSGLGLYDSGVDSAADALYRNQLLTQFLPRLQYTLEKSLASLNANDAALLPTLRAYLMLLDPQRRDAKVIGDWAGAYWTRTLPGNAGTQETLKTHLDTLLAQPFDALQGNERVIAYARQQLQLIPVAQRIYAQVKSGPDGQLVDIYPSIGGNTQLVFGVRSDDPRFSVPKMFMVEGYKALDFGASSPLLRGIAKDRWLYGEQQGEDFSDADLDKLGQDVRQLYLNDYGNHWRTFLGGLHIARFGSMDGAVQSLKQIVDPSNSPFLGVLRVVAEQTRLISAVPTLPKNIPGAAKVGKLAGAVEAAGLTPDEFKPTQVDREFKELQQLMDDSKPPAPIGEVVTALRALHDQLAETSTAASPGEAALNAAKARMGGAGGDANRRLSLLAPSEPAPVSTWLREIAGHGWDVSLGAAKGSLDSNFQQRVTQVCQRGLANRFPFNPGASADVAMQDFNEYFKPDGVEQSFVKEFLTGFVDTQTWRPRAMDGQGVGVSGDTLAQLRRAQQIRSAFFGANPAAASVKFTLKPLKLDSAVRRFELDLGDGQQPLVYTHGPKIPTSVNWQGGVNQRVRVIFEDLNDQVHRKEYEGDWALFRLLNDAKLNATPSGGYEIHINVDGRIADYQLIPASSVNPFSLDLLGSYRCPQKL